MSVLKRAALGAALVALSGTAAAACEIEAGSVRILGNDFGAIHAMVDRAQECASDTVTVEGNLTTEHREIQVAALTADPAQYTSAIVANGSIVPLMNADLIRPLDDLVEKYGQSLQPGQLIKVGGKTMAVAFMANAQHLFVRKDILEEVGAEPPTSYEEVIEVGNKIREAGLMDHPFALNTQTGWNLGQEFVNMYLGHGGSFFKPGTAEVDINNEKGVAALEMLRALMDLSNPDFLTFDSNASATLWEGGELALANLWGSRAGPILDDQGSTEEITSNTMLVAAPSVGGGETPATTLWWDGFTISKNISDEDAEATFKALVHGIDPAILEEHNDQAVWLLPGYKPTPSAVGVAASVGSGAKPYPMLPYMGLLHTALGNELSAFLQGRESAEQALSDVEAAYTSAAKEQGFL